MKIELRCPLCGATGEGEVPDDYDGDNPAEIPCEECIEKHGKDAAVGVAMPVEASVFFNRVNNMEEAIKFVLNKTQEVMHAQKGELESCLFIRSGDQVNFLMIGPIMQDKDRARDVMKTFLKQYDADEYIFVSDSWTRNPDPAKMVAEKLLTGAVKSPSEADDRKEAIVVVGQTKGHKSLLVTCRYDRDEDDKTKVTFQEPTEPIEAAEGRFCNMLPIFDVDSSNADFLSEV